MKGRKDHKAAAIEAFQEAGVRGRVHKHPMGAYTYRKTVLGQQLPVRVMVYLLEVEKEAESWREKGERTRRWMSVGEAAVLVKEAALAEIIQRLAVAPAFD